VAIFNEGKIVQAGTPSDVYERPRSRFVADFVGSSNVLSPAFSAAHCGQNAWTSLRPEKVLLLAAGSAVPAGHGSVTGAVSAIHYQGAVTRIAIDADGTRIMATLPAGMPTAREGETITFHWASGSAVAMESS
jgi:putative spermidine/putrescine transport system ATP-binding protein